MDDAAITALPDDPALLKSILAQRTRERDEQIRLYERRLAELQTVKQQIEVEKQQLEVAKLRIEVELLRLKKLYYGPRADRLQHLGDVAQLLLAFACDLEARAVNPGDLPEEPLPEVGTVRRV